MCGGTRRELGLWHCVLFCGSHIGYMLQDVFRESFLHSLCCFVSVIARQDRIWNQKGSLKTATLRREHQNRVVQRCRCDAQRLKISGDSYSVGSTVDTCSHVSPGALPTIST